MPDNMINMRLHEIERTFYDPRADFLAGVALDENVSRKTEVRLMREAEQIYKRARAYAPRSTGEASVRKSLIDVLRRVGGAS